MWTRPGFALDTDALPCGVALMGDDGALLAINDTLARLLELDTPADLEGLRVDALLSPSARVIMQMVMQPMLRLRGKAQEICLILRSRNGQDVHVLCHGVRRTDGPTPVNHCVFMPVEQRHQVEEQLVQTWRMTEQVPGVLFQLEIQPSGQVRFLHLSDNIVKLTGLSAAQLKQDGSGLLDSLLGTERDHVRQLLQLPLTEGRMHVEELRYRRPGTDKVSWCELRFIPRTTPDGSVQWNGYLCDITRHKAMEEQLRENDQLRVTATLAAGIAHDFNNMLGSITGLAEVCMLSSEEGSRLHTNLGNILQTGRKAAVLVRQMLEYARQMPQVCEPLSLCGLLHRSLPLLKVGLPAGVQIKLQTEGEGPILADAVQIEQVLFNLVNNAGYAMREGGGTITLTVQCTSEHSNPLRRPAVHLQVRDEGCGIATEDVPRIFEPFFTTKPVGEGTGLGLAAAYGIVKGHHGHIGVRSTLGQGTVFDIWLPREAALQPAA